MSDNKREQILVVDDEKTLTDSITVALTEEGYEVTSVNDPSLVVDLLKEANYDVVVIDLKMPTISGLELLEKIKPLNIASTIIAMSGFGSSEDALSAIKLGATDFISKPFSPDELIFIIRKAQEREHLKSENEVLKEQVTRRYSFSNIVSNSDAMVEIFEIIKKISDYSTTVLIQGESGTGKELIAKAIHYNSLRRNQRFVAINCGAIPENLLESELFGHKRGAFTDATRDKKGLFEEANGGTILLDEIGELPAHLQVKLLRVLQERIIRPVGDTRAIPVDVRVIAATLRDIESDVLIGRFRDDLFYRLNVITIRIPALRDRKEDIPILINYFLKKNQEKLGLQVCGLNNDAIKAMVDYSWPGNIRELENCIERAMILTEGNKITLSSLPKVIQKSENIPKQLQIEANDLSIKSHTRKLEIDLILKALEKTGGNRTQAAKFLEISHRTLLYKLKEYSISDLEEKE